MLVHEFQRYVIMTSPTLDNHQSRTRMKTECGQNSS